MSTLVKDPRHLLTELPIRHKKPDGRLVVVFNRPSNLG